MAAKEQDTDRALTVSVQRTENTAIVTLSGDCTMDVSAQIRHSLVGLAAEEVPLIIVDLSDLDFIDSGGLGGLVAAHIRARRHHGW